MDGIVNFFKEIPSIKSKRDDDFADRLSSRYTAFLLVIFAIIVSLHSYVGDPIKCWHPVHFTGSHSKYTNSYCWVKNTYYLHFSEPIPAPGEPRKVIPYYQWIPFILIAQVTAAVPNFLTIVRLFHMVWRVFGRARYAS